MRSLRREELEFYTGLIIATITAAVPMNALVRGVLLLIPAVLFCDAAWRSAWTLEHPIPLKVVWVLLIVLCWAVGCWKLVVNERQSRYAGTLASAGVLYGNGQSTSTQVEFGDSGVSLVIDPGSQSNRGSIFKFDEDSNLRIEAINGKVQVSTTLRDRNGKMVAELLKNEWKVPTGAWDRNYNSNALEVKNDRGLVALQVRALKDRIQLAAEWYDSSGSGWRFMNAGDCVEGKRGGVLLRLTPTNDAPNCRIKPIFEYPSAIHFGELRH